MDRLFMARDYRRPDDRMEWPIGWCTTCQYGRLEGNFSPTKVGSFYSMPYYTHDIIAKPKGNLAFLDRLRTHLAWRADSGIELQPREIAHAGQQGRLTFCDLGCGSGGQLRAFKELGYQVIGVEPDPKARSVAGRIGDVLDGTAEDLPPQIADRQFDVVLFSHVLEHCIDPVKALANAKRILAADGTLVIEVPNNGAIGFAWFKAAWPSTDIPRHLNFFTEQSLRALLQRSGFKITDVKYVGYTRQFVPEWIAMQEDIWRQIGTGSKPKFGRAAWRLLFRTAFASRASKYDSIRVHAKRLS
jgi:SAM-dependent methyltransferase